MKKRVFATLLWFYAMWYAGAFVAEVFGLSPVLGPIVGAAGAALIGGDPRGIIWKRPTPPIDVATGAAPGATVTQTA